MDCRDCNLYEDGKCRSGKVNPVRKEDAALVVKFFGPRCLCIMNPHREPMLQRMYGPSTEPLELPQSEPRDGRRRSMPRGLDLSVRILR